MDGTVVPTARVSRPGPEPLLSWCRGVAAAAVVVSAIVTVAVAVSVGQAHIALATGVRDRETFASLCDRVPW